MVRVGDDMIIEGVGLDDLRTTADQLIEFSKGCRIWLFEGDLGAGKTKVIQEICSQLGVNDNVLSPTFSIINEYLSSDGPIYHFDFYRVKDLEEALNVGVEDYFFSGYFCFIEWPELIMSILPSEYLKIDIDSLVGDERRYKLTHYGSN
jgi:tRNA threonylcarbamoyladenosine biosynthesis protein TsaE